jgi:hypothetical protein
VVPGDDAKSLLLRAVRHEIDDLKMPPDRKLSAAEIADLETWVKMGAPDPRTQAVAPSGLDVAKGREFWSFRPVRDYPPPGVRNMDWPLTAVDRFILNRLEAKGLVPVEPSDPRTLIRRATLDLTGLPPTPEEIDRFLAASTANPQAAYVALVDRLLASPHYGERWGRHWLDVVRYADTAGDNSDYPVPQNYRYRNWVIRAFQQDMPFDQFVREQLAGDLLPADADRTDKLIATGYLANARRFGSYEDARYQWYLTYEDTIDNLGRTFLGLTINCCRCHDHKFDPLLQEDYYALYGFFSSTRYPWPGIELDKAQHDFVPLASSEQVAKLDAERRTKLAEFDARIQQMEKDKADEKKIKAVRDEREKFAKKPLPYETVYAVAEGKTAGNKKVGNACIQIKGDPERLGREVPRHFPVVLGGQTLPPGEKGSGRLQLANWIVDPANPLTARVMVNRIWHNHFGRGLVPTPSDFGKQGRPPTHPELLDFLARRFVESGWSVTAMHRLIMLSRTYQLASRDDPSNQRLEAGNELLWRFIRRRLDAESIRDALLAVSGGLDRSVGGPHPFPDAATWNYTQHAPFKAVYDTNRRSVYLMTQRIQRHPFLALFDGPDTNAGTAARVTSTTALQALYLMNDPFVHEQARRFAARIMAERRDDGQRIERAFVLLFGRPPEAAEAAAVREYLAKLGPGARAWESVARALFIENEFVYVN